MSFLSVSQHGDIKKGRQLTFYLHPLQALNASRDLVITCLGAARMGS